MSDDAAALVLPDLRPELRPVTMARGAPAPVSRSRVRAYAIAAAAVAAVTLIGLMVAPNLAASDVPLLYLFAILIGALGGRGPAVTASALSVVAFDFFFVPPRLRSRSPTCTRGSRSA